MAGLRICLSPGGISGGGIGQVMLHLAEGLLAQGHAVDLLHMYDPGGRQPPEGCRLVDLGPHARRALPRVRLYLAGARPDLIISARDYVNLLMLAARGSDQVPLVWTYHTHRASEMTGQTGLRDRAADWMARQVLAGRAGRRPEALVAVSDPVARGLEADMGLAPGAVRVIENPVWTQTRLAARLVPCPHPWLAPRAPMARPPDAHAPVILAVGRLVAQKGFDRLVAALQHWPDGPAPRLIILGEGPLRATLQAQIAQAGLSGQVDLAGHVPDVLPYMARADLFVMPSRWEGFPLVLIEALGCGCPVVASDCPGGLRDLFGADAPGDVVAADMPADLARAMARTLAAPDDAAARLALAHRYTSARAAERYLALAHALGSSEG